MHQPLALRVYVLALLVGVSAASGQTGNQQQQPTAACPAQPSTLRAMRNCYRPLLVFAPAMDDPQMLAQFNQLKGHIPDLKSRDLLYVPIVPEGHNQPIPGSRIHTASLSEDELAAVRHHFKVEANEFLVILIGKDGGEKLNSPKPVTVDQLKQLIDSIPMRKSEAKQDQPGDH
jgi:hypothetical protein